MTLLNQSELTPLSGMKMKVEESDQDFSSRAGLAVTSLSCIILIGDMGESAGLLICELRTA